MKKSMTDKEFIQLIRDHGGSITIGKSSYEQGLPRPFSIQQIKRLCINDVIDVSTIAVHPLKGSNHESLSYFLVSLANVDPFAGAFKMLRVRPLKYATSVRIRRLLDGKKIVKNAKFDVRCPRREVNFSTKHSTNFVFLNTFQVNINDLKKEFYGEA